MIESAEIERMRGRNCIVGVVTLVVVPKNCLMVMRAGYLAGDEELTVTLRVRAASGIQRFVFSFSLYSLSVPALGSITVIHIKPGPLRQMVAWYIYAIDLRVPSLPNSSLSKQYHSDKVLIIEIKKRDYSTTT